MRIFLLALFIFAGTSETWAQKKVVATYEVICETEFNYVKGDGSMATREKIVKNKFKVSHKEGFVNAAGTYRQDIDDDHSMAIHLSVAPNIKAWGKKQTALSVESELRRVNKDGSFVILGESGTESSVRRWGMKHDDYYKDGKIKARVRLNNLEWLTLLKNREFFPDGMPRYTWTECILTGTKRH